MSRIIAGHFQLQDQIDAARAALNQAGFADSRISAFFVNQPGQHDLHAPGPVVGALVGAHVDSLYSFSKMKEAGESEKHGENNGENRRQPRHPGMLIAVALGGLDERERALEALHRLGAEHIEEAQGTIANGDWHDFDPLSIPVLVA